MQFERSSGRTHHIGTCNKERGTLRKKSVSRVIIINSLFKCMALMATFPWFVQFILATEIQRNEQAEREGQTAERNVREDIGIRYDIRVGNQKSVR